MLLVLEVETYTLLILLQLFQAAVNTALRIKGTLIFRRIKQYRGAGYDMCKDRLSPLQRTELQADQILGLVSHDPARAVRRLTFEE